MNHALIKQGQPVVIHIDSKSLLQLVPCKVSKHSVSLTPTISDHLQQFQQQGRQTVQQWYGISRNEITDEVTKPAMRFADCRGTGQGTTQKPKVTRSAEKKKKTWSFAYRIRVNKMVIC